MFLHGQEHYHSRARQPDPAVEPALQRKPISGPPPAVPIPMEPGILQAHATPTGASPLQWRPPRGICQMRQFMSLTPDLLEQNPQGVRPSHLYFKKPSSDSEVGLGLKTTVTQGVCVGGGWVGGLFPGSILPRVSHARMYASWGPEDGSLEEG